MGIEKTMAHGLIRTNVAPASRRPGAPRRAGAGLALWTAPWRGPQSQVQVPLGSLPAIPLALQAGEDAGATPARRLSRTIYFSIAAFLLLAATSILGMADDPQPGGSTYSVVICGLGGAPEYEKLIEGWGKDLVSVLKKNAVAEEHVYWLAAKKEPGVNAESRQDEIVKIFESLAARLQPHDFFELFLIGHGSFDEYDYRFNIPGPDITASRLNELLAGIRAERQVVVNMTSSSGASVPVLRRKGRVVITATSAGRERNFSAFPRYFIQALRDPAADADKNQEISALEAFRYASREVARYFQSSKRLATEHAMLEDRGEGEGAREPGPENGEGLLAANAVLVRLGDRQDAADTPEAKALRDNKRRIEEQIEALKYRKASMNADEYSEQLEQLLIGLSKVQQQLDNLEKK